MAKQHVLIVNRILASYLKEQLNDESLQYGGSDLCKVFGVLGLCEEDRGAILDASKKRLKQLEKASKPLGERVKDWPDDIRKFNEQ